MSRPVQTRRELVVAGGAGAGLALTTPAHARLLPGTRGVGRGRFLDGVVGRAGPERGHFWGRLSTSRARATRAAGRGARSRDERGRGDRDRADLGRRQATLKARIGGRDRQPTTGTPGSRPTGLADRPHRRDGSAGRQRDAGRDAASRAAKLPTRFFNAHHDALTHDLDVYAFLGDYTYEYDARRSDASTQLDRGPGHVDPASTDLTGYRSKLRLYQAGPGLRELHRLHPIVHLGRPRGRERLHRRRPGPSIAQRNAGYRANFEWLPRIATAGDRFPGLPLTLRYGANAELFLLDERQYRGTDGPRRRSSAAASSDWVTRAPRGSGAVGSSSATPT